METGIYREILNNLRIRDIKGYAFYLTDEQNAQNLAEACKGNYQIKKMPLEEMPEEFKNRIGLKVSKLEEN